MRGCRAADAATTDSARRLLAGVRASLQFKPHIGLDALCAPFVNSPALLSRSVTRFCRRCRSRYEHRQEALRAHQLVTPSTDGSQTGRCPAEQVTEQPGHLAVPPMLHEGNGPDGGCMAPG